MNIVVLQGKLSRPPEVRPLADGTVVGYEVTVKDGDGPAVTAPVVWYDPPAAAYRFEADDEVTVVGEVRRRFFRAGGSTQSRTEVVADEVVPTRQRAKVTRLVERAVDALAT